MKITITRVYDNQADARRVVSALESAGVDSGDISIVANTMSDEGGMGDGAATGAGVGATVGGGAGLLAGLGVLALPGLGPVVAAGWLAALAAGAVAGAVTGAAAGGLLGALSDSGVPAEEADMYAEGIRRGGSLVSARVDESDEARVLDIMDAHQPWNMAERRDNWRKEGWDRFDPNAPPRTPEEIIRERNLYM
jgi:hypothetical protein